MTVSDPEAAVPRATLKLLSAMAVLLLKLEGNKNVQSVNPLVGETNDGYLNDIRSRPIAADDVFAAIANAKGGPVEEGAVGAGTGTVAFGKEGLVPPPAGFLHPSVDSR
jgi:D-aminopeptidase